MRWPKTPRAPRTRSRLSRPRRLRIESLEDRAVPADLTLTLADPGIVEGTKTLATLTRSGDLSQPLTVVLDSSDATEVNIPGSLTIAAGKSSIGFGVFGIDDTAADGVQSVNLLAWVDGQPGTAYATVKVYDNDSPPSVQPDSYEVGEDESLTVSGFGVLGNDYSPNDELTASVVSGPSHGTLVLLPTGGFTYTPHANYFGPDSFTYRATDPAGLSGTASVSLTVWAWNDPLLLNAPGPQTTAEDTSITFSAAGGNAITVADIENPRVMVALLATPGILTLRSTEGLEFPYPESTNNSNHITFYADSPAEANAALEGLVYTPAADFTGPTRLSILVQDMTSMYFPIEVYTDVPITVTPVNDPPVAANDSFEAGEDQPLTVNGLAVLSNDTDIDGDPLTAVLVNGPSHGTVTLNPGGGFTYTPHANYFGSDSFTYRAADAGSQGNLATVSLIVWGADDPTQVSAPDARTTAEDTPLTFSAATGTAVTITDPESPRVQVILYTQDGILTLASTAGLEFPYPTSANGSSTVHFHADSTAAANAALDGLVFTPAADFNGSSYLGVLVHDLSILYPQVEAWAKVSIAVTAVNDAPLAIADGPYTAHAGEPFVTTTGGGGMGVGVINNDTDVDGDTLSAVLATGPAHGTLELNSDGSFTYTPDPTYSGTDTFTYRASDGQLLSDPATVTITVTPRDNSPVATDDSYTATEDETLTVSAPGVLGNDSDPNGDPLTAVLVSGPTHGTVTLNSNGSFTYTPAANYYGPDSFTYRAADADSQSSVATVSLTVAPVSDPLGVTMPGPQTIVEDTSLTFSVATGTAIIVTDADNPRVRVNMSSSGTLSLATTAGLVFPYPDAAGNNSSWVIFDADSPAIANAALDGLVFTPWENYTQPTQLMFQVEDITFPTPAPILAFGETPITITPVNDAPVAVDDGPYTVEAGELLTVNTGPGPANLGVLVNDVDVDWDRLFASVVTGPAHGTLTLNPNGSFTYTADPTYSGTDTFTYRVSDGQVLSDPATVTIDVTSRNWPPVSAADTYSVDEDGTLSVPAAGVLANDYDPEGLPLTAHAVTGPAHGTLVLSSNGGFTYTPTANYSGADEFWYRAFDGAKYGPATRVALTVNPVNDVPVAGGNTYTLDEDTPLTVPTAGVLANDTDADGDPLTATVVTGPAHGSLTLNPDGSFAYTPAANYHGPDSFTYRAADPAGTDSVATVSLTVRSVNDAPVAVDDAYSGTEDTAISAVVPGVTEITMVSDPGDYIGQGQTYYLTPANATTFTVSRNYDNGVSVWWQFTSGTTVQWWRFEFAAPDEGLLMPGMYANAMRFPFQSPGRPGLDVSGNGRGSNTLTGWFRIDEIAYGPAGEVLVFAATFEQHSEGMAPAMRGTVRYNAGGTAPGGVVLNDSDPVEGSPLTAVLVQAPQHGQLVLNPNGTFLYVPHANFAGTDTFQYKVSDGTSYSNVATVTLAVAGVNDAPVNVVPGLRTLVEDTTLTFSAANGNAIRVTDVDADGSPVELRLSVNGFLTFPTTAGLTFVTGSNGGNLIVVQGTVADLNAALEGMVFRPGANFNGTYSLQVRTNDLGNSGSGGAKSDLDYVDLNITPVNDAPQNVVPLITPVTPEDTPLTFSPAIWASDVDASSGASAAPIRVTLEFAAGGGTLSVTPGTGVTITGNGTGQVVLVGRPTSVNNVLRTLTFTPAANANNVTAPVQIRMTTDDQANGGPGALTDTDVFAISVTPVNDAPTTVGLAPVSVNEDAPDTSVTLAGSFADIEDGESGLTYSVVGNTNPGLFGSVSVVNGVLTLNYAPNANGSATLTVRATDSGGLTVDTPLVVTVAPVNDAPTAGGLPAVSVAEDSAPTAVTLSDHFADLEDGAGGLSYEVVGNTNPGLFDSASVSGGVLTLSYGPNASGSATLTIRATDGGGLWVEAPLAVTVSPVNDAPTSGGLPPVTAAEDSAPTTISLTNHFADPEDGPAGLTYSVVGNTNPDVFGSVSVADGVLTLNYAPNASGTATLTVRATDGGGLWVETPLAVTVTPVNDTPTTTGLAPVSVLEDAAPTSVTLTDSFADLEDGSGGLTYSVVGNTNPGLFGSVSVSGSVLTLHYAPDASGTATVTVRATDGGGLWVEAPLAVTVGPVNDAPTTSGLSAVSVAEDAAATAVTLTNHFADLEDGPAGLTYSVVGNTNPGLFGSVSVAGGVLTLNYTPNLSGSATLTVRATDSGGLWVETPLAVTVRPVNDAPTFTAGPNVSVASSAGPQTVAGWATNMSHGPADESGQALTFEVFADSPLLFGVQPAINPATGALTFTPLAGASGTATVTVVLRDTGGTADSGVDASAPVTFTITLNPPAGTPGVQVIGTELVITGGSGADSVTLATVAGGNGSNGIKVTGTINGQSVNKTFKQTLTGIRISTGDGNDTVTIADGITLPTMVDGGAGDDSLKGGGGTDLIFGGTGNDTINGAAGDDDIDAGAGNDSVSGGLGRDLVFGQAGNDTVQGGDGNDILIGGLGADHLFGQSGEDILVAGSVTVRTPASDSLRQVLTDWNPAIAGIYTSLRGRLAVTDDPVSVDRLMGDAGTDWFWSADPADVLDIGAGEQRN